jgi:hypothetical protein
MNKVEEKILVIKYLLRKRERRVEWLEVSIENIVYTIYGSF